MVIREGVDIQLAYIVVLDIRFWRIEPIPRRIQQIALVARKIVRRRIPSRHRRKHALAEPDSLRIVSGNLRRVDAVRRSRSNVGEVRDRVVFQKAVRRNRALRLPRNSIPASVVVKEEENLVLPEGSTQIAAKLIPDQRRTRHTLKVVKPLVGLKIGIAVILVDVAMERVRS